MCLCDVNLNGSTHNIRQRGLLAFPRSVQEDDPQESTERMRAAGATYVFVYLSNKSSDGRTMDQATRLNRLDELVAACRGVDLEGHGCFGEMKFTGQPDSWHLGVVVRRPARSPRGSNVGEFSWR